MLIADDKLTVKLQHARRMAFANFDQLVISADATLLLANLFLNPDCKSKVDLYQFVGQDNKLADISKYIITAAPVTLAKYANKHKVNKIGRENIIRCFSIDHAGDISHRGLDDRLSAAYALSHLMTAGKIKEVQDRCRFRLAEIEVNWQNYTVLFKNIIIPSYLKVRVGDLVWHHFGVVIDKVKSKEDKKIMAKVKQQQFSQLLADWVDGSIRETRGIINFANRYLFNRDLPNIIIKNNTKCV